MKMVRRFSIGKEYSVSGYSVHCVSLTEFGAGELSGVQVATLETKDNKCFKVTRWPCGEVFRITHLKEK